MKWTKATGEKVEIGDMEDSHLLNTIAMLERIEDKMLNNILNSPEYLLDSLEDDYIEIRIGTNHPCYRGLVREARYRSLTLRGAE